MTRIATTALIACAVLVLAVETSCAQSPGDLQDRLKMIQLPPGFEISVFASNLNGARSLSRGDNGTIFVGTRRAQVYAVVDENGDYKADKTYTIIDGGNMPDGQNWRMPNGVAFKDGALYVAAISHIWRYDGIESRLSNPGTPTLITDNYPTAQHHGWKFIAFGPDGKLYVPVGAPCNVCEPPQEIFATITRMNADGTDVEIIAKGVRNTVGFDWRPGTNELWFAENGADEMGNDLPADELNKLTEVGQHFGYPYCHQGNTPDPRLGQGHSCSDFTAPAINLGPHVAAIGMRFYTGNMFPAEYKNQILIAEHGSWNRDRKIGYRVTLVRVDNNGNATSYEDFATGWLQGQNEWGRPADVLVLPDGSLLVSDDKAHAIYRIAYKG